MKAIITIKTGKGSKSTQKEIDRTVDMVLDVGALLHKQHNFVEGRCKCMSDGTSLILKTVK